MARVAARCVLFVVRFVLFTSQPSHCIGRSSVADKQKEQSLFLRNPKDAAENAPGKNRFGDKHKEAKKHLKNANYGMSITSNKWRATNKNVR